MQGLCGLPVKDANSTKLVHKGATRLRYCLGLIANSTPQRPHHLCSSSASCRLLHCVFGIVRVCRAEARIMLSLKTWLCQTVIFLSLCPQLVSSDVQFPGSYFKRMMSFRSLVSWTSKTGNLWNSVLFPRINGVWFLNKHHFCQCFSQKCVLC